MCGYVCVCDMDNPMHYFFVCSKVQWSHILRDLSADSLGDLQRLPEMSSFLRTGLRDCRAQLGGPATSVGHVSEVVAPAS